MTYFLLYLTLLDPTGEVEQTVSFDVPSLAECRKVMPAVARAYLSIGIKTEIDCKLATEEDLEEMLPTEPGMIKSLSYYL